MSSISASASAAPRSPSSRIVSRRDRRERTSAYSPMTKNALSAMSSAVRTSSSAVIAERAVSRYFEEDRLARAAVGEATSRPPRPNGRSTAPRRFAAGRTRPCATLPPPVGRAIRCCAEMRIVSLVPHATELLFALGLGDDVVAVTHECDFPPAVRDLPQVTRDVLPPGLGAAEIDAAVRERTENG